MRRVAYLKPHPVPPSTMAATRMAPAMEPIIRLVALGPVKGYGGKKTWVSALASLYHRHVTTQWHGTENITNKNTVTVDLKMYFCMLSSPLYCVTWRLWKGDPRIVHMYLVSVGIVIFSGLFVKVVQKTRPWVSISVQVQLKCICGLRYKQLIIFLGVPVTTQPTTDWQARSLTGHIWNLDCLPSKCPTCPRKERITGATT